MSKLGFSFSQDVLSDLIEQSSDLIQITDDKGRFLYINKAWKQKLGYLDDDLKKLNITNIIHPESVEEFKKIYKRIIDGEKIDSFEINYLSKNGKSVYVKGSLDCFYDDKRNVTIRGMFKDVTQLQRNQEMGKTILQISVDFINVIEHNFNRTVKENLKKMGQFILADKVNLIEYDSNKGICNNIYEWYEEGVEPYSDKFQNDFLNDIYNWIQAQMKSNLIYIPNIYKILSIPDVFIFPILNNNNCYGFIVMDFIEKQNIYSEENIQILSAFSQIYLTAFHRIKLVKKLKDSETKYRALIYNVPGIVFRCKNDGKWTMEYINEKIEDITGFKSESFINNNVRSFDSIIYEEDREFVYQKAQKNIDNKQQYAIDYRVTHKNGKMLWIHENAQGVYNNKGDLVYITGIITDITYRKQIEELLNIERKLFKTTLLSVGDGVISTDNRGNIVVINPIAEQLTGWKKEEAVGKPLEVVFKIINENTREKCTNPVYTVLNTKSIIDSVNHTILISKEGIERSIENSAAPIRDKEGKINGVVLVFRDCTEKKERQEKVEYLSFHDQLTGIYNRRFFVEQLKRIDNNENYPLTLIMADVNGLKLANDAFGHLIGDEILQKAAELLVNQCCSDDIVARIGGDEFIILLPKTNKKQAEYFINKMKKVLRSTKIGSIRLSISFGWATKKQESEKMEEIYKKAEDYMYQHKLYESPSMRSNTIKTILQTMFEKIPGEKQHSDRVSKLCEQIGRELGYNSDKIAELKMVGLMHDIGKITLNEALLYKTGKLDKYEWVEVKRHPETGYRILSEVNEMAQLAEYTLAHHENYDGTGYPKGLKGDEIPIQARIIRVVDSYDAMITNDRSYRNSLSKQEAIEELIINSGTQFDPEIVKIFVEKVLGYTINNE